VLARPFDDRLFFAGEATHGSYFSTAHGAHDSGVRAAEQVIAALDYAERPELNRQSRLTTSAQK